jgi:hypothetical protein
MMDLIRLGETKLTAFEEKHPADEIGKALSRAGGILTSLTNCYDKNDTDFQISVQFMFEAVSAVENLLGQATEELAKLYSSYDLNKISHETENSTSHEAGYIQSYHDNSAIEQHSGLDGSTTDTHLQTENVSEATEPQYLGFFGPTEQVSRLANRIDSLLEAMPAKATAVGANDFIDKPAGTYNELLEKLTAMADAAAYNAHQGQDNGQSLLPVLENLRADMLRIRSVA